MTAATTAVAVLILILAAAYLGLLVWGTFHAGGVGWIAVVLGWLAVLAMRPRRRRLPPTLRILDPIEFPGLHGLVRQMADALGVAAPRALGVDLSLAAYLRRQGVRGTSAMVVGLPLMTLLPWESRLGVIGHQLGQLCWSDSGHGRLIDAARSIIRRLHEIFVPWDDDGSARPSESAGSFEGIGGLLAGAVELVVTAPFLILSIVLERMDVGGRLHRECLADRRSAEIVGTEALETFLLCDVEGVLVTTAAAARRGEDPFVSLRDRYVLTDPQTAVRRAARQSKEQSAHASHPSSDLRARLLAIHPLPRSDAMPPEAVCRAAEKELERLRHARATEYATLLRHGLA